MTTIITISRQLGCGGAEIGRLLAERFGYHYADREVLEKAAKQLGVPGDDVSWREERPTSFWDRIASVFTYSSPYTAPPIRPIPDDDLFALESKIIRELADRESCVVVGRGGAYVLKGRPGAIHVFLHAPTSFRIHRVMNVYHARNHDEAVAMIHASDKARKEFHMEMGDFDWLCAANYHLSLDTSTLSREQAADLIASYVRAKTGEKLIAAAGLR